MKLSFCNCLLLVVLSFSLAISSDAQTNTDELIVAKRIAFLVSDNSIAPPDVITELDSIIERAKDQQWTDNLLNALALKAELLVLLEKLSAAEQLINEYSPLAISHNAEFVKLRFELTQLSITDAKGFTEDVIKEQKRLLNKAHSIENQHYAASIYLAVGQSQYINDNLSGALNSFKQAYDINLTLGDESNLSEVMNALANLYIDLNDSPAAIKYFNEAIAIKEAVNDKFSVSILLYNLGKAYIAIDQHKDAKNALEQALAISESLDDYMGVLWARFTLADIYLDEDKAEVALEYYTNAATNFEQSGDRRMQFQALIGMAKAQIKLNDVIAARSTIQVTEQLLILINNANAKAQYTEILAMVEALDKNYEQAYLAQRSYSQLRQAIFKDEQQQNTEKLRIQFDVEVKENNNRILKKENELSSLKIAKQQEQQTFWVAVVLLAFVVIAVIIFALYKQVQHRNRFKEMALRDHLTSSPNRRAILQLAKERFNEAKYTDMALSIGIIDLDWFKKINDNFGHDVGDEVLKAFAQACSRTFRKQDRFGRYGGEEWLVVLADTSKDNIEHIFQRLKQQLNHVSIDGLPKEKIITFSMGVAQYHESDDTLQTLINRADENLYKAKTAGRDNLVM